MQVTVTNITASERLFLTGAYKELAPAAFVTFSRTADQLDNDISLKKLRLAGKVTIAVVQEAGDGDILPTYSNATRPGPTLVPVGTEIFNSDDLFPNVSDGTNWRDPTGVIT
jgi:hypothetical protein